MPGLSVRMTSKTSSLKALLLRAWRERWSDLQWGIHIKTILPRGVSGDVYNLADCILQQALVGSGPNELIVSYLKHSLSSQLISYAAVLQRVSKYDSYHKPHCIISLLEFLETIQDGITCRGKPEEGLLAGALLSTVHWLLSCMNHAMQNIQELKNGNNELSIILEKPVAILNSMTKCKFTMAMLYLAKHESSDMYNDVIKLSQDVEALVNQNQPLSIIGSIENTLKLLCRSDIFEENEECEPVTYCLQALIAVEVILNPSSDTQVLVNELLMVKRLKNYSMARLYSEIMRACLISLNDVLGTGEESQWGAFTFLKVPQIFCQLHNSVKADSQVEKSEFSQDVVDSFELLLQFTPLLDLMDAKSSCNSVECLLSELLKVGLVTEKNVKHYTTKRETMSTTLLKQDQSGNQSSSIPKVIIRAEPTLTRILKTLDTDYARIQEALLSVLGQVLTGKSFELILAVATVEGKLRMFVTKLIKFNECSKQVGGESGKASQTRALLFDMSFLMLCSIVNTYGSDVVLSEENGNSFFEQWVRECMVERGRPKCPELILQHCDSSKVDSLLAQFNSGEVDFKSNQAKWHEVCLHVPAAIKEVLLAWEHEALTANDVKRILDAMRSKMCCLPVCAAAWLCSYMQILNQDSLLKPMNMVQQFLTPLTNEELMQQDNFKERSSLMIQIIRKMQYDVHPPIQSKSKVLTLSHSIISRQPISEQLESVWSVVHQKGWVSIEATHAFESLLNTGGSEWFILNLVKEVMKFRYQEELNSAVDLSFAIFHLDIENCTLALVSQVLPQYLHNILLSQELVEPQSSALAKLCVYCIFASLEYQNNSSSTKGNNRKRNRPKMETDDLEGIPNKILCLSTGSSETTVAAALDFGTASNGSNNGLNGTQTQSYNNQPITVKEPLQSALVALFNTFAVVAGRDGEVSQQTHFVFQFLKYAVCCGQDRARLVLEGMPNTLVPCLLRALPDLFSTNLILHLYDLQTVAGRKSTARDLCLFRNLMLKNSVKEYV